MRIKNGQQILNTDPVAWENQYQKEGRFGQRFLWLSLKTIPQMPLKEALAAIDLFLGNDKVPPKQILQWVSEHRIPDKHVASWLQPDFSFPSRIGKINAAHWLAKELKHVRLDIEQAWTLWSLLGDHWPTFVNQLKGNNFDRQAIQQVVDTLEGLRTPGGPADPHQYLELLRNLETTPASLLEHLDKQLLFSRCYDEKELEGMDIYNYNEWRWQLMYVVPKWKEYFQAHPIFSKEHLDEYHSEFDEYFWSTLLSTKDGEIFNYWIHRLSQEGEERMEPFLSWFETHTSYLRAWAASILEKAPVEHRHALVEVYLLASTIQSQWVKSSYYSIHRSECIGYAAIRHQFLVWLPEYEKPLEQIEQVYESLSGKLMQEYATVSESEQGALVRSTLRLWQSMGLFQKQPVIETDIGVDTFSTLLET